MIEFRCSKCDGVVRAPETHAGKKGRCPTCQEVVPIPEKSERLEPVEFPCEKCGHGMKAPGKFVGRQGKCAKCGHLMTIPAESVPHGDPIPVAKPVAKPVAAPVVAQPAPSQPSVAKPAQAAASKPPQAPAAKPATPPNAFAQPQPQPASSAASAKPRAAAPLANDPFADLGNLGAPAMAPMPIGHAMPAHAAYVAPAPYGAAAHRPSGNSGDPAGVTSMILGIVSLLMTLFGCVCLCIPILSELGAIGGIAVAMAGFITGFLGKTGFRVAGIIMSSIAFVLGLLRIGLIVAQLSGALAGVGGRGFDPSQFEQDPWEESYEYESDFGSDF